MKKIIMIVLALSLGACSTPFGTRITEVISAAQNFTVTQGQVDTARSGYDGAVLAPLNKYADLPRCKTGQKLTLNNPCHDRRLLKQIREVDMTIEKNFAKLQNNINSGNNSGAVAAYDALISTIDLAKSLINQTGVMVLGF